MQTTEEFLQAYASLGVKTPRSMYAQLTYDSVWTVALTLQQTMENLARDGNKTRLEDFRYKSGSAMYNKLFDIMGKLEFMGVSVSDFDPVPILIFMVAICCHNAYECYYC